MSKNNDTGKQSFIQTYCFDNAIFTGGEPTYCHLNTVVPILQLTTVPTFTCLCWGPSNKSILHLLFLFIENQSMEPELQKFHDIVWSCLWSFWNSGSIDWLNQQNKLEQNHILCVFWSFSRCSHWLWGHWRWRGHSNIWSRWGNKGRWSDGGSYPWH